MRRRIVYLKRFINEFISQLIFEEYDHNLKEHIKSTIMSRFDIIQDIQFTDLENFNMDIYINNVPNSPIVINVIILSHNEQFSFKFGN
jgi:hypothetical protein